MLDTEKLEKEAREMFEEVRGKLDDPNYMFNDGSEEAWCQQLRECAHRCTAAGLNFWARQLETAAGDVAERGGDWA